MIMSRKGYVLIKIKGREERKKLRSEGVVCVVNMDVEVACNQEFMCKAVVLITAWDSNVGTFGSFAQYSLPGVKKACVLESGSQSLT